MRLRSTTLALIALLVPVSIARNAAAAEFAPGRHVLHGERVRVCNAIGTVSIVPTDGADVIVEVTPRGADSGKLRVIVDECNGEKRLKVVYPGNRIVDPDAGAFDHRETTLDGCCGREHYRFTRRGDGLEARADLVIRVPRDQELSLGLGAGEITAEKLNASLAIDTGGAPVTVHGIVGALSIDSGSGGATISGLKGALAIDSGSGEIRIDGLDGKMSIDSGSGEVTVNRVRADKVAIESGSGTVRGDDVVAGALAVESGSGGIEMARLNAKTITFDSGSGRVRADLVDSPQSFRIESGSGGVSIRAPRDLDARLQISCSKRDLKLSLPVTASTISDDYFEGRAGNGRGLIVIEASSGGVSLQARTD